MSVSVSQPQPRVAVVECLSFPGLVAWVVGKKRFSDVCVCIRGGYIHVAAVDDGFPESLVHMCYVVCDFGIEVPPPVVLLLPGLWRYLAFGPCGAWCVRVNQRVGFKHASYHSTLVIPDTWTVGPSA